MKAIIAKYLPPTLNKGARIKVSADGVKSKITSRHDYDAGLQDAMKKAIANFSEANGWGSDLSFGMIPDERLVATFNNTQELKECLRAFLNDFSDYDGATFRKAKAALADQQRGSNNCFNCDNDREAGSSFCEPCIANGKTF